MESASSSAILGVTKNPKHKFCFPLHLTAHSAQELLHNSNQEGAKSLRVKRGLCLCDLGEVTGTTGPTGQLLRDRTEQPI